MFETAKSATSPTPLAPPKEPTSVRLTLVLTLVCALSAFLVSVITSITDAPIAKAKAASHAAMLRQVLPPGVSEPIQKTLGGFSYYEASGALALEVENPQGYAGKIRFLIGFDAEGKLYNFKVLEHTETPGLGAHLASPNNAVLASAQGKPADTTTWKVTKDGGEIDSITAATISSRAACEALALAASRVQQIRKNTHD